VERGGSYTVSISGYGFSDDGDVYLDNDRGQVTYGSSWNPNDVEIDMSIPDGVCSTTSFQLVPDGSDDPDGFAPAPLFASVPLCPDVANPPTVAMKLEQVGPTVISTDGNCTEDTTVRVTAVDATSGATLLGWTGAVRIMEDGTFIYSENDGTLPGSVNITAGGTTTFLARSLAGPAVEGTASAPDPAKLTTLDFPLWTGVDLSIPQWITSGTPIDSRAIPPVYDWLQTRTRDIFAGYPNDPLVEKMFTSVKNYTAAALTSTLANGGKGGPIGGRAQPATPNQISLNPFYTAYRVSKLIVFNFDCGCIDTQPLPTTVIHEARHTCQYAQAAVVTAAIPNNDRDKDSLVEAIDTAPTTIFLDTGTLRTVCNENASPGSQLLSLSYQGDSVYDAPPNSSYAREMDSWVFATGHVGGDTTPPALAVASAHAGSFTQGQTGATITLTVTNLAGFGPTSGAVTVTETLPGGLALVGMASQDPTWVCNVNSCARADPLAGGAAYPSITVTVNVAPGATNQLTIANASGGGSAFAASTIDTVVVVPQ
jgi:hypothetical protein